MKDSDFFTAVKDWIEGTTNNGVPAIRLYQSGTRPAGIYAGMHIFDIQNFARDTVHREPLTVGPPLDVKETIVARRTYGVTISVYRAENALQICEKLKSSLFSEITHQGYFLPNNMGFVRSSNTRHLPELVKDKYENRAEFDVFFNTAETFVSEIESIEEVNIAASLSNSEEVVLLQNINVSGGN